MHKTVAVIILLLISVTANAAWIDNIPKTVYQPDGTKIDCFASGDEFFNRLHDSDGYTIIQSQNGYYYYAEERAGKLVPSTISASAKSAAKSLLTPNLSVSKAEYARLKSEFYGSAGYKPGKAPHQGYLNNVVIYIRFADQPEYTQPRTFFDAILNDSTAGANSVYNYYREVSYNKLGIVSYHFPPAEITTNLSYQDSHPRGYYSPYNATTNPDGYIDDRTEREHLLLKNAVEAVAAQIPASLSIDGDNDNKVDNVTFIIRGETDAWASLLWPHRWSLWSENAYINGKQVKDYIFMLSDATNYLNRKVFCHELFHALGAPDLYHYSNMTDNTMKPVGKWDIMESGSGHMGAYMKWKYANNEWITNIPTISQAGTYKIKPITEADSNCYKILSPNSSNEFFVVENRVKAGTFESGLTGSGLLVYRINTYYDGNADGNDEVYIYRKNGTPTVTGLIDQAHFPTGTGLTMINDQTNPKSILSDGSNGELNISGIVKNSDNSITFNLNQTQDISAESEKSHELSAENYPNPFNNSTNILFNLPQAGQVNITLYNTSGQLIENISLGQLSAGKNQYLLNADKLNSGMYFYSVKSGAKQSKISKMLLLK